MDGFSPSRLQLARQRRGLKVPELGEAVGVSSREVRLWESGEVLPSHQVLARVAHLLAFPMAFFAAGAVDPIGVVGGRATAARTSPASFRALQSLTVRDRERALAAGVLAVEISESLAARLHLPAPDVPGLQGEEPETAAEMVRAQWGLGRGPVLDLVGHLEAHGARVFWLVRECREVDAFAFWRGTTPYVLLAGDKTGERLRFDAAHELAHLVLHRHGEVCGREAEREADQFASAFLMPAAQFRYECPSCVSLRALMPLKRRWGVSLAAAVRRCHDLGIISPSQYRSLCIQLSERGRRVEPEPLSPERSLLLPKALGALRAVGLSPQRLAASLHIPWPDFRDLVGHFDEDPVLASPALSERRTVLPFAR